MKKKREWLWLSLLAIIIILLIPWSVMRWHKYGNFTNDKVIRVLTEDGKILKLPLEEYLIGVVAAEMPAGFGEEALKAQAVAARTYAVKCLNKNLFKDEGYDVDTTVKTQAWLSDKQLRKKWGVLSYLSMLAKVKKSVEGTKGKVLVYDGKYVDAFYHSSSGRKTTEQPEEVWGGSAEGHFQNVVSGEENPLRFKKQFSFSINELAEKLGQAEVQKGLKSGDIKLLSRTKAGRIRSISILGKTYLGTQIRTLLGLASTDFEWLVKSDHIVFTTYGYGHAVGMSQYGANDLANRKYTYDRILEHYYPSTQIKTI
ncbi:MAG: stage II sporulation protein D [Desulfitobacteriaceae bacterium]|nr:stage II sporulation protein D [Desulfitobacteriaceae bacterium]MDD4345290.1 stage II sporulation protein D [Desulfitobacteriaceae bacterium]MDD4400473.1 stage II sporulation protein D [Desulfitobacteriaceae bacterium]